MTIRDFLKIVKDKHNKSFLSYLSGRGYSLKLLDSVTDEVVLVTVDDVLEEHEVKSADIMLFTKYGALQLDEALEYYFIDIENPTTDELNNLCDAIIAMYKGNWYHIARALGYYYNPTWNKFNHEVIAEEWPQYKKTTTTTDEQLEAGTMTSEQLESASTTTKVYGLDSTEGVNDGEVQSDAGKSQVVTDAGKTESTSEETIAGKHTTTTDGGGNVGSTMSSQIIGGELDLYASRNYIKIVVRDISDYLGACIWEV